MPTRFRLIILHSIILSLVFTVFSQTDKKAEAEKIFNEGNTLFSKQTNDSLNQANLKFVEALAICEEISETICQITVLEKLVSIALFTNNGKKAIEYLDKALPLSKLSDKTKASEADFYRKFAKAYEAIGDIRKAILYINQSIKLFRELKRPKDEGDALTISGMLHRFLGETSVAAELLSQSLVISKTTGDKKGEASALSNLAGLYSKLGDYSAAVIRYQDSLLIFEELKDVRARSVVTGNIALVWQYLGEYQKALDSSNESLELKKILGDKRGQGITLSNLAVLYREIDNIPKAIESCEQALVLFREGNNADNEGSTSALIASLYFLTDQKSKSLEYYNKALELVKIGGNKERVAQAYSGLGYYYFTLEPDKAFEYFQNAKAIFVELKYEVGIADQTLRLAKTFEKLSDNEKAEINYQQGILSYRKIGQPELLADGLYSFAKFHHKTGKYSEALLEMQEAIGLLEKMRATFANPNNAASFFGKRQNYYDFYSSLLMQSHKIEPKKALDVQAWQISEQGRARSFLDSLASVKTDIRQGVSPELLDREKVLRQTISSKDAIRISAIQASKPDKLIEKELESLFEELQLIETKIRTTNPKYADLVKPKPANLSEIQAELDANSLIIEFALGEQKSFIWLIGKDSFESFELPKNAEIEPLARKMIESVRSRTQVVNGETIAIRNERLNKSDVEFDETSSKLGEILFSQISAKAANKKLLIVPNGILQYVPFAALKVGNRYLVETNEIVSLPSASSLPALRNANRNRQTAEKAVAIFADPVFSEDDLRVKNIAKTTTSVKIPSNKNLETFAKLRGGFSRLRFSRGEANAISSLLPKEKTAVGLDFSANLDELKKSNLEKYRIVHFATHGLVSTQNPELSGLLFSLIDENGNQREGFLRLNEIYNMKLNAEVVVLSACDTALGKEIKGEGLVGITRGFMYSGAKSVIASLWQVDDRATSDLMKRLYEKMLKENLSPSNALRQAQLLMLKNKATSNPYYWSAFTIQGDVK
jgi:CHAT domain-containing protein/tetratricopeptide (TPR) repeat protein